MMLRTNKVIMKKIICASLIVVSITTTLTGCLNKNTHEVTQANTEANPSYTLISSLGNFRFNVPTEIYDARKTPKDIQEITSNITDETQIIDKLTETSICEQSENNFSLVKFGQFDLLAFVMDEIEDVAIFKTVDDFNNKAYIGDITITQRGERELNEKTGSIKFPVAMGITTVVPQYTEDMFMEDKNGNMVINQEVVDKAMKDGTLQTKPKYTETNAGYLSLIADKANKKTYGLLVGYALNNDLYKDKIEYIADTIDIVEN